VVGFFFWSLRMGSGWDPRPSSTHPAGRQVRVRARVRARARVRVRVRVRVRLGLGLGCG